MAQADADLNLNEILENSKLFRKTGELLEALGLIESAAQRELSIRDRIALVEEAGKILRDGRASAEEARKILRDGRASSENKPKLKNSTQSIEKNQY